MGSGEECLLINGCSRLEEGKRPQPEVRTGTAVNFWDQLAKRHKQ